MVLNIDNCIQTTAGLSLSFLSISGLMCVNRCHGNQNSEDNSTNNKTRARFTYII